MYTMIPKLRRFPSFPPASDREFWVQIAAAPRLAGLLAEFGEAADGVRDRPVPALPAALYMEFRRTGNRIDYETPYFERRRDLEALVVAETIEHRGRYLDAIVEYLWSILGEYTWVLPAHAFRGDNRRGCSTICPASFSPTTIPCRRRTSPSSTSSPPRRRGISPSP